MLDVKRLRVLREVAAKGSFSAAAESLAYTQSAVSQQLATLEREVGAVLVDRSKRPMRPTRAGAELRRVAFVRTAQRVGLSLEEIFLTYYGQNGGEG